MSGILYGVGLGPGDSELLTLRALRLIRTCPVIAYPAPETGDSLARRIAAPHLPGGQVEIAIRMALTAESFPAAEVYDRAARDIAGHLDAGRDVAALCLGDPFLYGSFMYLFARFAGRRRVEIVPGVSSVTAAAAAAGLPLAARDDTLAVIPATLDDAALAARLAQVEAAVIVKLGRHLPRVRDLLERLGLADRATYVAHATMTDQRIARLSELDDAPAPYFSLILIHKRGQAWR